MQEPVFEEDDPLVDRAEAFISRRRGMLSGKGSLGQVNQAAGLAAKIALGPSVSETMPKAQRIVDGLSGRLPESGGDGGDTEFPTLNDAVRVAATTTAQEGDSQMDPDVLKILVSEIARNISRQITAELPALLYNTTLPNLEGDLRRGIVAAAEMAAKNFIAQRLKP